jgi:5,10-methenyltetrahydrofolate synthetase
MNDAFELKAWRKAQRNTLIARRAAVPAPEHQAWSVAITALLVEGFPLLRTLSIGFYWPMQGEFDTRFAIRRFRDGGAVAALPVVVQKQAPLQFREWRPGVATSRGVFDLPVPEGTRVVVPQAVLMPPVGFDARGYRLGYGGGYFDRTLASITPQPLKIGVAFELSRIDTIHPQDYDIPMDFIVTEAGIHEVTQQGLKLLTTPEAAACAEALLQSRHPQGAYTSPPCYGHQFGEGGAT